MMIHLSLIAILILCGVQSMQNGRRANIIEFPFIVSIQHQLFHLCSGTIIDKYHIVTVAHVVVPYPASGLLVVPGMSVVRWPYSTSLTVKKIYPHPYYQDLTAISFDQSELYWENDIAILRLNEPLSLNSLIEPIALSTTKIESYRCFECTMISWNYPDESNLESLILMWDIVHLIENNRCEQRGIRVLANQQSFIDFVETAFISTENIFGDLGSPIICGGSMVGLIVKEVWQGEATSPATFLSTLNYNNFISATINGHRVDAQSGEFPYMVSIWHRNKHACGGIIVNAIQVITAGQCLRSVYRFYPKDGFRIAAGSNAVSLFDSSVQWYLISNVQVHPLFHSNYHVDNLNWWTENDIGLITVSRPFLWSPTVQKLILADADDFSTKQLCQVLHWTPKKIADGREYRQLALTNAVLVNDGQPLVPLGRFQVVANGLYAVDRPEFTDIGNPIICGGHPLGIMVKTSAISGETQIVQIVFLRIRPYALEGFFHV